MFNRGGVSIWKDEKVLETDGDDVIYHVNLLTTTELYN